MADCSGPLDHRRNGFGQPDTVLDACSSGVSAVPHLDGEDLFRLRHHVQQSVHGPEGADLIDLDLGVSAQATRTQPP